MTFCPFKKDKCGGTQEASFSKENESATVKATNLEKGESCTWKVKASCGAPAFKVKKFAADYDDTNFEVDFIEYESGKDVKESEAVEKKGKLTDLKAKRPSSDKPSRD